MEKLDKIPEKAFRLRGTTVKIIESRPEEEQGKLAFWIIHYGITREHMKYPKKYLPILRPIFSDIDVELRRYDNKIYINRKIEQIERYAYFYNTYSKKENRAAYEQIIKGLRKLYVEVTKRDISNLEERIIEKFSLQLSIKFRLVDESKYEEEFKRMQAVNKTQVIDERRYRAR